MQKNPKHIKNNPSLYLTTQIAKYLNMEDIWELSQVSKKWDTTLSAVLSKGFIKFPFHEFDTSNANNEKELEKQKNQFLSFISKFKIRKIVIIDKQNKLTANDEQLISQCVSELHGFSENG